MMVYLTNALFRVCYAGASDGYASFGRERLVGLREENVQEGDFECWLG
jgi:hypothetical protein